MPATITAINPANVNPGDVVTITGTGFVAGAVVVFAGASFSQSDPAPQVTSATQIITAAPDFGGDAVQLQVSVQNPGTDEDPSTPFTLGLNAWPPVADTYPLCGLLALKRSLGLAPNETDTDDQLRQLILIASAQLARIATYDLKPVTLVGELYDGDDTPRLNLRHAPVTSVVACMVDGETVDVSELKVYPEYIAFDDGDVCDWNPRLRAGNRIFGYGSQNVSVTYTAGFAAVPSDLAVACMIQVGFLKTTLGKQGLISDTNSVVNATTQYSQLPVAPAARIAANRYRKTGVKAI
jgi:hypothetical protein